MRCCSVPRPRSDVRQSHAPSSDDYTCASSGIQCNAFTHMTHAHIRVYCNFRFYSYSIMHARTRQEMVAVKAYMFPVHGFKGNMS